MKLFLITFALFAAVFLIMSVGYILARKRIHGSCGGLDVLGIEKECDCPEPCERRKQKLIASISEPGQSPE